MNFLKDRVRARRVLRWQAQIVDCSNRITAITATLQNMDRTAEWEKAERLEEERARVWDRRNDLYTKLTQE